MLQPPPFSQVADTVSVLAAPGATDPWVMTLTFLVVGVCDVVTGVALRPAAPAGRLMLIGGAIAGMLVAANPVHTGSGSVPHAVWASLAFTALAVWPVGACRRGRSVPWGLRPAVCFVVVAVQLILLGGFVAELISGAGQVGLSERVVGAAQAIWPLAVILSCRFSAPGPRPEQMARERPAIRSSIPHADQS